jgi:ribosomal RNA assembly protein
MRILTIPSKRAVRLLKNKQRALKDIEAKARVKISITNESDIDKGIRVDGSPEGEWSAEQVLKAIDLGFDPKDALTLLNDEVYLEQIDLEQSMRGSASGVERQKARLIGTEGKAKRVLQELSEAKIAISDGPMLGILGGFDEVRAAKEAVLQILEGKPHAMVFSYLEGEARKREARRLGAKI